MSHFTCLVVGNNPEQQLAPYQENNMDDCPEQYLEFFDVTDEYVEEYEKETVTRIKLESGELVEMWDDRFRVSGTYGIGTDTRLFLEIIDVRVERLQDISEEDAVAEGIESIEKDGNSFYKVYESAMFQDDPVWSYRSLWESINGVGSWDKDPYCWVVEFKRWNNSN